MSEKVRCEICHFEFDYGDAECQGCNSGIVYGATTQELRQGFQVGFIFWFFCVLLTVVAIGSLIIGQYFLFWVIFFISFIGGAGGARSQQVLKNNHIGRVRAFRKQ